VNSLIRTMFIVVSLCFCTTAAISAEKAAVDPRKRVAIVEFDVKGNVGIENAGAIIAEWMIGAVSRTNKFDLKERVLLKKVLDEQSLSLSGAIDEKTTTKIGKVYGIEAIITGSVIKWGDVISVTSRLIDSETGSILKTADIKTKTANDIPETIDRLAQELAEPESQNRRTPKPSAALSRQIIQILARNYSRSKNVEIGANPVVGNYGEDVIHNGPPYSSQVNWAEYLFKAAGGLYELWVEYAAAQPRPVSIYINDSLIKKDGLSEPTGGWYLINQKMLYQSDVILNEGDNNIRLYRGDYFPHIRSIKLIPKTM
jgi:TolB-like protein